jgi:lipoprotein-anchoring transpeptidase ErfK/SrfK
MVGLLEKRLVKLGYHLVKVNNTYDYRTADAIMAFRKVQGMDRLWTVTAAVWKALADPRPAQPKFHLKGRHIEVDLSRQVLYVVDDGVVTYVMHVSTGKPSTPTPPGRYRIRYKRPGMNASGMYYSSYFIVHYAIHGYHDVPSYNASHGCVRVPMWTAKWIYGIAKVGMRMMIYR